MAWNHNNLLSVPYSLAILNNAPVYPYPLTTITGRNSTHKSDFLNIFLLTIFVCSNKDLGQIIIWVFFWKVASLC